MIPLDSELSQQNLEQESREDHRNVDLLVGSAFALQPKVCKIFDSDHVWMLIRIRQFFVNADKVRFEPDDASLIEVLASNLEDESELRVRGDGLGVFPVIHHSFHGTSEQV